MKRYKIGEVRQQIIINTLEDRIKKDSIVLEQILLFDHDIEIPSSLKTILNIDVSVVPHWSLELNENIEAFNVFSKKNILKA